jgi:hypothetical protein
MTFHHPTTNGKKREDFEALTNGNEPLSGASVPFSTVQYFVSRPHSQMGGGNSRGLFIQSDPVITEHI